EKVSTTPYGQEESRFKFFIFLNLVQAIFASATAVAYLRLQKKTLAMPSRMLLGKYFQVAFSNAIASPFSYAALKHIDYPTMILTKSCKLIPVMCMNILLYRRRFPTYKYVCVALITLGVSGFMLLGADEHKAKKGASNSSLYGMLLVLINLAIDGITNSTQDQIFQTFKVTGQEMMCFMNLFMAAFMSIWLINPFNPELGNALAFCQAHPAIIKDIVLFCICGALGQCFIFYTLEQFGSLSLVTVTVTRKLFTILLSVVAYGHTMNIGQSLMVGVVFSGIGLEAYVKRGEKIEKMGHNLPKHSPKHDQISFSQVEMAKKDKVESTSFVGMASLASPGLGSGFDHFGGRGGSYDGDHLYSNGNSTQLLQPGQQYLQPTSLLPPGAPLLHQQQLQQQLQQQQQQQQMFQQPQQASPYQPESSTATRPYSARASYVSSSATKGISVGGGGGGGRQRASVAAPKRY
ncbi:UDP-galactose transporter, partial [Lunasporangiospora selenospora]